MNSIVFSSVIFLSITAAMASICLLLIARKFSIEEDPRIEEVTAMLPGINCGACGYPGCHGFAEALVAAAKTGDIADMTCSAGGISTMEGIGKFLGVKISAAKPTVAVLRCGGSLKMTEKRFNYEGIRECAFADALFSGERGCGYGCLGFGDCIQACRFDALHMDPGTGLPVVTPDKCVSCGACVKACPRHLFELRPLDEKKRSVWVNCRNRDKGSAAIKICKAACIGCGKCVKACPDDVQAITLDNNLAYIDPDKCIPCGKCVSVCPTHAIKANFDPSAMATTH